MIRINLLKSEGSKPAAEKRSFSGGTDLVKIVPAVIALLLVGGACGYLFLKNASLNNELEQLDQRIASAKQEVKELQKALDKVDEFQAKKGALEQRVQLISDLKRRQNVPVHLLDQLSRELPDFLWLESLFEQGGALRIVGRATTYNAVSNFYNNLRDSSVFTEVTLGTTRQQNDVVTFQLSCKFTAPDPAAEAEPAAVSASASVGG